MANAIVTIKLMPESPDVDLDQVKTETLKLIAAFAGEGETRDEIEPIAFGLKALKITFVMDESLGSPDSLEEKVLAVPGVNSFEVIDVRRAVG